MPTAVPTWGFVTAAPHEHLIHVRDGRVLNAAQGGSCFKRPTDTVALVDTSVHRVQFTADQVTQERAGVAVTGLAVFRIVRPLLAWRMLNLESFKEVEALLREMFVGATRRLVANLTLEACLTQRKESLAVELMAEVAPVVSGKGQAQDDADRGWGIAIDTIEIQDVRVLSKEVFERLQAPFREQLSLSALQARAEVMAAEAQVSVEQARRKEDARREMMALEEERLAAERERARQTLEHEAQLARASLAAQVEREDLEGEARRARLALEDSARLEREERVAESQARQAELHAQAERVTRETAAALVRLEREAEGTITEGRLRELALTTTLPEVARAWRGSFDKVVLTGGAAEGGSFLAQGLTQALASLETMGFSWPRKELG